MIQEESNKKNELAIKKEQEFEVIKNELMKTIETEMKVLDSLFLAKERKRCENE